MAVATLGVRTTVEVAFSFYFRPWYYKDVQSGEGGLGFLSSWVQGKETKSLSEHQTQFARRERCNGKGKKRRVMIGGPSR